MEWRALHVCVRVNAKIRVCSDAKRVGDFASAQIFDSCNIVHAPSAPRIDTEEHRSSIFVSRTKKTRTQTAKYNLWTSISGRGWQKRIEVLFFRLLSENMLGFGISGWILPAFSNLPCILHAPDTHWGRRFTLSIASFWQSVSTVERPPYGARRKADPLATLPNTSSK